MPSVTCWKMPKHILSSNTWPRQWLLHPQEGSDPFILTLQREQTTRRQPPQRPSIMLKASCICIHLPPAFSPVVSTDGPAPAWGHYVYWCSVFHDPSTWGPCSVGCLFFLGSLACPSHWILPSFWRTRLFKPVPSLKLPLNTYFLATIIFFLPHHSHLLKKFVYNLHIHISCFMGWHRTSLAPDGQHICLEDHTILYWIKLFIFSRDFIIPFMF